ncbi:hypothetical protein EDF56_106364 [Novosphingobium sp. PhB165]|uniref:hypothetical protein n=1 Tax=Novosphingobium sp. PhB165 TaxID=2485105 RepID=UPI00104A6474|nr:hypothetical protein [Novosphingobium sp. PhB165]TCM17248.1 hypothetical protein EDF56_106364 [Novosphingobium sp. PhB165]
MSRPTDEALLRHAVKIAKPRNSRGFQPRWVAVMDTFAVGSSVAWELCARFDLNAEEMVRQ